MSEYNEESDRQSFFGENKTRKNSCYAFLTGIPKTITINNIETEDVAEKILNILSLIKNGVTEVDFQIVKILELRRNDDGYEKK